MNIIIIMLGITLVLAVLAYIGACKRAFDKEIELIHADSKIEKLELENKQLKKDLDKGK